MRVAHWHTMATSASSSDYSDLSDTENSISESHSHQSLSVGYFPSENTFFYEDMVDEEKVSRDSSAGFLPPTQGAWGAESLRRHFWRRDQVQGAPEQLCKLSIKLAWDTDMGSDHAVSQAVGDLSDHNQWMDKGVGEKIKLTSDRLENLVQKLETFLENERHDQDKRSESIWEAPCPHTSSSPAHTAQARLEELDTCQDSSPYTAPSDKDATWVPTSPPKSQEEEHDMETRQTGSLPGTSPTSPTTYATFCPNLRWAFCWLRRRLFSQWGRDHHPERAKRSYSLRVNRIQPQEGLEN